jgi:hypothetical protein
MKTVGVPEEKVVPYEEESVVLVDGEEAPVTVPVREAEPART